MYQYFIDWLGISSLSVDDNLLFIGVVLISSIFLNFIIDIIKFFLYYISGRK